MNEFNTNSVDSTRGVPSCGERCLWNYFNSKQLPVLEYLENFSQRLSLSHLTFRSNWSNSALPIRQRSAESAVKMADTKITLNKIGCTEIRYLFFVRRSNCFKDSWTVEHPTVSSHWGRTLLYTTNMNGTQIEISAEQTLLIESRISAECIHLIRCSICIHMWLVENYSMSLFYLLLLFMKGCYLTIHLVIECWQN